MKMTDRELNNIVDDVTAEIRSEKLDSATVESAAHRVWTRMTGEEAAVAAGVRPVEQIRNCDDFQALIPAYLQGYLSSARTTLRRKETAQMTIAARLVALALASSPIWPNGPGIATNLSCLAHPWRS